MPQLSELKVFLAAAEELSFSRAAERLHLSQSAISQNVQALERDFGVELFTRQGRSVRLTEAGQALLPHAIEIVNSVNRVDEFMHGLDGQVAGDLVIGCSTTSGKYLLPSLVAAFRRDFPLVRVRIKVMSRDEVIARLQDGRLSLGVTSLKVEQHDLEYVPFFEDRVILIVPANHPWATYGRALPADLVDEPMIIREEKAGTSQVLTEALAQHNITTDMLNVVMEIGNAEAIETAVEEGIGIAFISELAAARGLALGRVKQVEVPGLNLSRSVFMARNVRQPLTRTQDRFWSFVKEHREPFAARVWETARHLAA